MKLFAKGEKPATNDAAKRRPTPNMDKGDILFARLRRLEQRIDRLESKVSTCQRDVYRIERKQGTLKDAPTNGQRKQEDPVAADEGYRLLFE